MNHWDMGSYKTILNSSFFKPLIYQVILLTFVYNLGYSQTLDSLAIDCIRAKYLEKEVDIDSVLTAYEGYLIKEEFLSKNDEIRYTYFFRRMVSENDFIGSVPEEIFKEVSKVEIGNHISRECFKGVDEYDWETLIVAGKFYHLAEQIANVKDIENAPKELGTFYLKNFSEEEMQAPFMRITLLLTIAWMTELNGFFPSLLPPIKG